MCSNYERSDLDRGRKGTGLNVGYKEITNCMKDCWKFEKSLKKIRTYTIAECSSRNVNVSIFVFEKLLKSEMREKARESLVYVVTMPH